MPDSINKFNVALKQVFFNENVGLRTKIYFISWNHKKRPTGLG